MKKVLVFLGLIILPFSMISNVKAASYASDTLKGKVVTSGDGLYVDKYNDGRYVYKGGNPNNFIKFNDELWRIISVEKDGTLKIIRVNPLDNPTTDTGDSIVYNGRDSIDYGTYCAKADSDGCNAWSKSEHFVGGWNGGTSVSRYEGTVTEDSLINRYLNKIYYKTINNENKCEIATKEYNIGAVGDGDYNETIEQTIASERGQTWNGNIALANVSDVLLATTNEKTCGTITDVNNNYYSIINGEKKEKVCTIDGRIGSPLTDKCYNNCAETNWLMPSKKYVFTDYSYVLLNGVYNKSSEVFAAAYHGLDNQKVGSLKSYYNFKYNFKPVTYLRRDMKIVSGDGSETNPYELKCDECDGAGNTISDTLVVDVPPTSMFISVFIIGGFILIAAICIVIYLKVFKKKDINK